ncbi:MAG TPA: hypothetical protein VNO30_12390 [Kofleriaceae bacterium]|nr:hypothetical protein [Kofleriaceae bacterium]
MRRLLLLALAGSGSAGCEMEAPAQGSASLVLDIPNGVLDPKGYTAVEITLHDPTGDTVRSAAVGADGAFDLGDLDPRSAVSVEAVLRDESGAAVGYGRTASALDLAAGATITVQVRRPIVYIAGLNYTVVGTADSWFTMPAVYSDLTTGVTLDGTTTLAEKSVLLLSAGPALYSVEQAVSSASGLLTGPATLRAVGAADHALGPPLGTLMLGAVQDGAGSDDGQTLVIGTAEKLYGVDLRATPTLVRELAPGSFSRVAIVAGADGGLGAVAIKNRVSTTGACNPTAELWWIGGLGGEVIDARMVATGGFADVAADRGRAWYVDACKGELGEVLADGARPVRADLGKPTALAVSNGQAWIGVERAAPATLAILVVPADAASATPRTLWSEPQDQILGATDFPGVERRLPAQTATFLHLEIGAGGDYIAAATAGDFFANRVNSANFPQMQIETRELRVFDAASGGAVQRYRSWCDGSYLYLSSDIRNWSCATTTGQTAPTSASRENRLSSLAFLFGKR